MKYIKLVDKTVTEIIPEFDSTFPDVPITERYSEEYLNQCVAVEDDTEVHTGWIYDGSTFTAPEQPESPELPEEPEQPISSEYVTESQAIKMLFGGAL